MDQYYPPYLLQKFNSLSVLLRDKQNVDQRTLREFYDCVVLAHQHLTLLFDQGTDPSAARRSFETIFDHCALDMYALDVGVRAEEEKDAEYLLEMCWIHFFTASPTTLYLLQGEKKRE